jgi:hypothetical protein
VDTSDIPSHILTVTSADMPKLRSKAAATEFHRFPDLPAELRLMIWSMIWSMRPGPDVVDIDIIDINKGGKFQKFKLVVTRPQTILIYINRESRACTGLSRLDLRCTRKPWESIELPKQSIYVDFQRDTFRIAPKAIHCLKLKDLAKIRIFELLWIGYRDSWLHSFVSNKRSFLSCTSVERLILRIPIAFLRDVIITSEEPDWAEKLAAFQIGLMPQRLRLNWDHKLRILREGFEELRKHHPAWVPPKIILTFTGYDRGGRW